MNESMNALAYSCAVSCLENGDDFVSPGVTYGWFVESDEAPPVTRENIDEFHDMVVERFEAMKGNAERDGAA